MAKTRIAKNQVNSRDALRSVANNQKRNLVKDHNAEQTVKKENNFNIDLKKIENSFKKRGF